MHRSSPNPLVAIACGGTGGHLFPGLAVADELLRRDCDIVLLISPKEVDQQAVRSACGMDVVTLPAVGLTRGSVFGFASGFQKSLRAAKELFRKRRPQAVLAMGGFTSAPPILAGRAVGAKTFIHESNTMPGRANRWLAHVVDEAFVYFHEASGRMSIAHAHPTGMPVRSSFLEPIEPEAARMALGLDPLKPVLLVMGGSQGASAINRLMIDCLPILAEQSSELQFIHLTGANDVAEVQNACAILGRRAIVRPFLTEMELAMRSATVGVSRSGASSLAEIAATILPAVLIPYPTATDDHQYYNALAFVESNAALLLEQGKATPERLAQMVLELLQNTAQRAELQTGLTKWRSTNAASEIADRIINAISQKISPHGTNDDDSPINVPSLPGREGTKSSHVPMDLVARCENQSVTQPLEKWEAIHG